MIRPGPEAQPLQRCPNRSSPCPARSTDDGEGFAGKEVIRTKEIAARVHEPGPGHPSFVHDPHACKAPACARRCDARVDTFRRLGVTAIMKDHLAGIEPADRAVRRPLRRLKGIRNVSRHMHGRWNQAHFPARLQVATAAFGTGADPRAWS